MRFAARGEQSATPAPQLCVSETQPSFHSTLVRVSSHFVHLHPKACSHPASWGQASPTCPLLQGGRETLQSCQIFTLTGSLSEEPPFVC